MTDIVLLQLMSSLFWLFVIGVIVLMFRREIGSMLGSLARLKIAGSSFEFQDKNETLQSYILLSETLIDMLSREEKIEEMLSIMSVTQIEKIAEFAFQYSEEVAPRKWNEEMLKNIAYLLLRFGRYEQSVNLCNALLKRTPDYLSLLNTKALALITTRLDEKVKEALPILKNLVARYPEVGFVRLNYALNNSLLSNHDEAYEQMKYLLNSDYAKRNSTPIYDVLFQRTREQRPDLFEKLEKIVEDNYKNSRANKND